jgi:hypothetical protein
MLRRVRGYYDSMAGVRMMSVRLILVLALAPGLVLPGGVSFRLCFCGLFGSHEHSCHSHAVEPVEEAGGSAHQDGDHDHCAPSRGHSDVYIDSNPKPCSCVTVAIPAQVRVNASTTAPVVSPPATACMAPVAIFAAPSRHFVPVADFAESSAPPTGTSRTLPLLI